MKGQILKQLIKIINGVVLNYCDTSPGKSKLNELTVKYQKMVFKKCYLKYIGVN